MREREKEEKSQSVGVSSTTRGEGHLCTSKTRGRERERGAPINVWPRDDRCRRRRRRCYRQKSYFETATADCTGRLRAVRQNLGALAGGWKPID